MKRILSILILAALLTSAASCGSTSGSTDTTVPDTAETTLSEEEAMMPKTVKDFGGENFHIIGMSDNVYVAAEEQNGNAINDALYNRDLETESKLNIDITYELHPSKDIFGIAQKSIMSGDHTHDLIINHVNIGLTNYASENLVVDWNTVPHVDFTKPYWFKGIIDSISINGKSPYAASDITIQEVIIMLYNKQLGADLGISSLYDYVYDGTWTWDKLAEISASVKSDINGDTKYTVDDRYGIAIYCCGSSWRLRSIPSSCNQFLYKNTEDGITLVVNNEKTQSVLDKICALFNGGGGFIIKGGTANLQDAVAMFSKGNYLTFFVNSASAPSLYNNLPFDYGILPLPKYDEAQENYSSLSWSASLLIPTTADIEKSGLVSEWLSYYGYKLVRPEFYDSMFSVRFSQDEDSTKMLDIIFDNIVFDPGMNFSSPGFYSYFDNMVMNNVKNFSSYYSSREAAELKYIEELNESFANFGN
ncbi:MAG: hypothetical protein E7632_09915 [Ruminococcaceae bacterium]|nr:hypothetical protein [Oscillospiraceae bacterium]